VILSSISIESGNKSFVIEHEFLIDIIHHKLIRNLSRSSNVEIPSNIEILGSSCFSCCKSLSSISFESNSQLTQIESNAFSFSSLQSIMIPSTVQILGSGCFSECKSLSSISFNHPSQFGVQNFVVIIPSAIRFVAFDAFPNNFQICIANCDSCVAFNRWWQLRKSGVRIDFRRILRIDSDFGCENDYLIDLSVFEQGSVLDEIEGISSEMYRRCEDGSLVIVHSMGEFESKKSLITEIENRLNLSHPCILSPIGFIFDPELTISGELKIVELYSEGSSLSEVISENPIWWTATAKAKAVAGIVLALRFAHSLGLIHGHLNSKNIHFDMAHRIQITDFCQIGLEVGDSEQKKDVMSSEGWIPDQDICGFVLILFEIIVGHPMMLSGVANNPVLLPRDVPMFVSQLIETIRSSISLKLKSFNIVFDILKLNDFKIMSGVDSEEVLTFVRWVESFE
jgi:hypothetical protein